MHVCVLGAGVVGLTTAWALSEQGHDVTIIDRQGEPGAEASFGNGAQLSYAYVAPLASPATLKKIPSLLLDRNGPLRVKPQIDPAFLRWGIDFLLACRPSMEAETTAAQLALGALSRSEVTSLTEKLGLSYGLRTAGKLVVFRERGGFESAAAGVAAMQRHGIAQEALSGPECLGLEPALRIAPEGLAGGIYTPGEQVGDCAVFCRDLAGHLRQRNTVRWMMNTNLLSPVLRNGRMVAVSTSAGEIGADLFVLSLGSGAAGFARQARFRLPVYPMKGYSLTTRLKEGELRHSVTDADNKVVFAPLQQGERADIRIAGIADLVGYDTSLEADRLAAVRRTAREALELEEGGDDRPWAGLRPATPDSRPVIGWSPVEGLFLNTGHGALGWTLAAGSARLTAELIAGETPSVRPEWFSLRRQ